MATHRKSLEAISGYQRDILTVMRRRNSLCSLLVLALSGCNLVGGKCTYELRSLDARANLDENGAPLAGGQILLSEQRGSLNSTSMYWIVTGTTLKGHVLSASLKDASDLSTVRIDLPLAATDHIEISQGQIDTRMGANLGGIHDMLAAGRGIIELQTDMSSRPTITLPLAPTVIGDWVRPYCS